MTKIIRRSQISKLLNYLQKDHLVIAPIEKEGNFVFEIINPYYGKPSQIPQIALDYPTTIIPPSKIALFPPKETMIDYNQQSTINNPSRRRFAEADPSRLGRAEADQQSKIPHQILFGVHDYDIQAINILDKVMSSPQPDYYYQKRRKNTIIIGIEHHRTPQHFDHYFPFDLKGGFDLFLSQMKGFFIVSIGSPKGEKLAQLPFFEESSWKIKRTKNKESDFIFSNKTKQAIEKLKDSHIWDELADICFGCGICSYVCPLCFCFETFDETNLSGDKCQRCRRWDACFLPDFFKTATYNPREKLRDRIYNWYHHKFVRMTEEYGHPGCVGCGRCIAQCPAKINFRTFIEKLILENRKRN